MEETKEPKNIHMGRNLAKVRGSKGLQQKELADMMKITQQRISQYEKKKVIDHETLVKFAEVLKVPVQILEEMEEDTSTSIIIENNNVEIENGGIGSVIGPDNNVESTVNNNPLEALVEMHKDMVEINKNILAVLERLAEKK